MNQSGPELEVLLRRMAETPAEFLADPRIGKAGSVYLPAVIQDLLERLDRRVSPAELLPFEGQDPSRDRNRLAVVLLCCWLLAEEWFAGAHLPAGKVLALFRDQAAELARQVPSRKLISDPDRREELVRLALAQFGFRPAGESPAQAQDRLASLSSIERARVLQASRAAEERARSIREALRRKAAEESADKWTRE